MTPADVRVIELSLLGPMQVLLPWLILHRDVAALPPRDRARAWPEATIGVAALLVGPLALLVHFPLVRRSWYGAALGLGWTALAAASLYCCDLALLALLSVGAVP